MIEQGRKFDSGKLRYDLVPVLAFEDQVKGLTYGTIKYDDNNWIKVPEGRKRYMAATFRHIQAYRKGEMYDKESGCHHLSCAINNLSFIVEKDLQGWEDSSEEGVVSEIEEASWIKWSGGGCPVGPDVAVDVKFRGGEIKYNYSANTWYWGNLGVGSDIVVYRVVKE